MLLHEFEVSLPQRGRGGLPAVRPAAAAALAPAAASAATATTATAATVGATAFTESAAATATATATTAAESTAAAESAAAAVATAATTIATETRRTLALTRDVHVDGAAIDLLPVEGGNGALGVIGLLELDETESAGLARHAIRDDGYGPQSAQGLERTAQLRLARGVAQIAHE
jgi:hypothetical protein